MDFNLDNSMALLARTPSALDSLLRGLPDRWLSANESVTLAQLLSVWTVHDLTHLHQLTRVLAVQYADAVGPFQKFLGVLHCHGHSAPA